jgi:hypothetical protein
MSPAIKINARMFIPVTHNVAEHNATIEQRLRAGDPMISRDFYG